MSPLSGPAGLLIDAMRDVKTDNDRLAAAVQRVHDLYKIPLEVLDEAAREIQAFFDRLTDIPVLNPRPREPWFLRGPNDVYWPAFEGIVARRLPDRAVAGIRDLTAQILNLCQPPRTSDVDTRGLVVGYVQSGKTTNFTGLIASAADAGYKLFIVLSGIHSNLRRQTQERLDADLLEPHQEGWVQLTDRENDFGNPRNASALLSPDQFKGRLLAVVKKNKRRLQNLNGWLDELSEMAIRQVPILIIDDEADQASLNYSLDERQRTGINNEIVRLLRRPRAAYVGYTATPFANILGPPVNDQEDLYPRDFVVSLPQPEGYFGPERIFGRGAVDHEDDPVEGCDMVRLVPVDDVDALRVPTRKADRQLYDPHMPDSLDNAIRYFLMATAERRLRGQVGRGDHSTMLVHATHYVDAHFVLKGMIDEHVRWIGRQLGNDSFRDELARLWDAESEALIGTGCEADDPPSPFREILKVLPAILESTDVVVDNGSSDDRLSYAGPDPVTVIVIGGNTLSRGLTLEGLVSSYFLRSSRNYDTLLQMGRWFGYRTGYEDLPRVWMDADLRDNFRFFALLEEEMRVYIAELAADPTISPADYAIRIRTHPTMQITNQLRMQNAASIRASFGGYKGESIMYHTDPMVQRSNIEAVRRLVEENEIEPDRVQRGVFLYRGVPAEAILQFLERYRLHPNNNILLEKPLRQYIDKEVRAGALQHWNVAIVGRGQRSDDLGQIDLGVGSPVNLISRSKLTGSDGVVNIGALTTKADYFVDLGREHRGEGDPGLLLLYPISQRSKPASNAKNKSNLGTDDDLIGLAIAFPSSRRHQDVEWAVPVLDLLHDDRGDDEPEDAEAQDREGDRDD